MSSPEFIAELSGNHLGSLERMLALIAAAAESGATAVKFQCWTPEGVAADPGQVIPSGPWAGQELGNLYAECWTPFEWFPELIQRCKEIELPWFSSVLDLEALKFLEYVDCPRYKIPSFELTDSALIRAVANTGKPMIMSTGMATKPEITTAVSCARWAGCNDLTLLHCVSAYPAVMQDMNLLKIADLAKIYPRVGLSDHSPGWMAAVCATALGAQVIEKHLTLLRADGGPDAGFSLEPDEFCQMVRYARMAALTRGSVKYGPLPSEIYTGLRRGPAGRGSLGEWPSSQAPARPTGDAA